MELDKEAQKPILPRDLFRNRFTWSCYEIFKYRLPWAVSGLCLFVGWLIIKAEISYKNVLVSAIFAAILFVCSFVIPIFWFRFYRLRNPTELAQQVLELKPGMLDIEEWDHISSTLNTIFYQKGIWGTPYFFFDGQHARQVFRENVLKLYLKGKFTSINIDEFESSKVYLQSVKEMFGSSLNENLPELVSEAELPRDAHKNRFLSNPGYRGMAFFFCLLLIENLSFLLGSFQQKPLKSAFLFNIFQNILWFSICWRSLARLVYPMMSILQGVKFLAIITRVVPGRSLDKWDEIAKYMNQYLADSETPSSAKFFDGKQCLEFYKKYFEPLSVGNSCLEYGDLIEIVNLTQPCIDSS